MKNLLYKLGVVLLLVGFTAACDDFDDMNIDPNNTTSVKPEVLLTNSLRSVSSVVSASIPVLYVQHFSQTQYTDGSRYVDVNFDFNGWYTGPLADLQHIIDLNTDEATKTDALASGSNANQIAVARIVKAYFYHVMTDRWGPLPLSQALQGRDNFKPAYDNQQAIYDNIFSELKAAAAQIDGGVAVKGDFILGGDMDKWRRFANTVRATAAMRLTKVDPAKAQSEFVDAFNGGLLEENVMYPYLADANNQNPWFAAFITRTDWAISDVLEKFMTAKGDPRLPAFADPAPNYDSIVGMPYGIDAAGDIPNDEISFPGSAKVRSQDAPIGIFTQAQVKFMLAEAAFRGWIGGDAQAYYEDAIKSSMEQWGVFDEAAYQAFINHPDVVWTAGEELKRIGEQKWVALYLQGYEAWAEWRRLGFPELAPAPDPLNEDGQIPRRHGYPTSERDTNGENYNAAVSSLLGGPDELSTRLWWDN